MAKPRIFLGSSGKQKKLLQALTRGLEEIAHVEPWTTVFNPGTTTLGRLLELAREVDFAAFVFAQDEWTSASQPESAPTVPAQASPRDNVFEAGGYFTTRSDTNSEVNARTSGVYLRADPEDVTILDGNDNQRRMALIAERLSHWTSIKNL
ncbi:MAG: hypothetical protein EOS58_10590 [Mesorhizobium sp.]|uniref:TIR domain-containing protein n=1 Tax=unclassified Mesorhizobium TaxID=325217 RepID=UPI000F763152|nr:MULTISPECIES: TIR domain-containing protein [unclassified Mesorhizobium]RVD72500.1 hypothetical protein EN751_09775 [Mesorhizobium sp. M4A.F.Ca.ET.029.04.2.1]AZO49409.1 hypothetical protein EJ073_17575 [Mesorhizobium sp. M4B.F.Ca.ET.058.02.1.1]RUX50898.1 hypothetical protein EOA33_08090 [Mesorhizobium sp. M4A.F.Ca.ET.050.02.1.1]RVC46897.1 hypothetical protein EN781_03415 [Mesorhizobium sp. M4A.F.Ca.ET.090.04.2.1]RVD38090.1 hypothetical protein EN742_18560 [Mesorhizobium sp. M4A.F.Ca.ET.020.